MMNSQNPPGHETGANACTVPGSPLRFYYYYNSKTFSLVGIGEHEGDWEMVQLHFNAAGIPLAATYSQHDKSETCQWGQVPTNNGHPVSWVGSGSHANYFWQGTHDLNWHGWTFHDYTDDGGTHEVPANQVDVSQAVIPIGVTNEFFPRIIRKVAFIRVVSKFRLVLNCKLIDIGGDRC